MATERQVGAMTHPRRGTQFSLASILLTMSVICVCLAALRLDIRLGEVVIFLTFPALIRTAVVATRRGRGGHPLTTGALMLEFLFSWTIIFLVAIVALVAAVFVFVIGVVALIGIGMEPGPLSGLMFLCILVAVFVFGLRITLAYGPNQLPAPTPPWRRLPRYLPAPLLPADGCYSRAMLYTPAMIAELAEAPLALVRSWQRRGWIVPQEVEHRLARFDFGELSVARTLAELSRAGIRPAALARKLKELSARLPHVERPLAELSFVVDGRELLVRHSDELLEPRGQLRMDFDSLTAEDKEQAVILSSLVAAEKILGSGSSPDDLARQGRELEEEGDLAAAVEMYRSALASAGPRADLCFELAEALYRLGDLPAARERYFMAIELDEDHAEARANLGCLLAEMGEKELAAAALAGAIACHADYADAHYHLARLLDEQGERDEAAVHWREFLRLAADSPWHDEARERLEC